MVPTPSFDDVPVASPLSARTRVVLASASPARLSVLRRAGLDPEVVVSGVDESAVRADSPAELALELARLKATAVLPRLSNHGSLVLIGCDSLLEVDGEPFGKPADAATARERWRRLRGSQGLLHTGHYLRVSDAAGAREHAQVASTTVHFADLSDAEIEAYVGTGEPLQVAGAFTLDGLGGAFVSRIDGDPANVVGISLPLLRVLLADLGVAWTDLWA